MNVMLIIALAIFASLIILSIGWENIEASVSSANGEIGKAWDALRWEIESVEPLIMPAPAISAPLSGG